MGPEALFARLAAPGVLGLEPYVPGKPLAELERELGIADSIKLASNENPLGPPAASLEAVRAAAGTIALYPDGAAWELKQALARKLSVKPAQITIGNGSNEILCLIAETFLSAADEGVHSRYAFLVYGLAIQATGARTVVADANPAAAEQPLGHCLDALRQAIRPATRLVFIANPNNPTGTWVEPDALRAFLASVPPTVLVVVDEAYADYRPNSVGVGTPGWIVEFPNLIVCRTFSKLYGLAGLRVGYAVSHQEVAALLNRVRQPFNVNTLAQVAALAALNATDHVQRSRTLNDAGLAFLRHGLQEFGWQVPVSAGNFLLADTGETAGTWYEALLRAGVIVRPVANYGLPRHLRITVGLPEQNERLLGALKQIRGRGGSG